MANPIDKGRVVFAAEKYPSNEMDNNGQPKMKNRYATIGRATKWPGDNGGLDRVELEIDSIPIGATGPVKALVFWDSEQQQSQGYQQSQQQPQQAYQQAPQQPYQQPQGYNQAPQQGFQQPIR